MKKELTALAFLLLLLLLMWSTSIAQDTINSLIFCVSPYRIRGFRIGLNFYAFLDKISGVISPASFYRFQHKLKAIVRPTNCISQIQKIMPVIVCTIFYIILTEIRRVISRTNLYKKVQKLIDAILKIRQTNSIFFLQKIRRTIVETISVVGQYKLVATIKLFNFFEFIQKIREIIGAVNLYRITHKLVSVRGNANFYSEPYKITPKSGLLILFLLLLGGSAFSQCCDFGAQCFDPIRITRDTVLTQERAQIFLLETPNNKKYRISIKYEEVIPVTIVNLFDQSIATYTGTWFDGATTAPAYNKTMAYSNVIGNTLTVTFTGNKIEWFSERKTTHGRAGVTLDNLPEIIVNLGESNAGLDWITQNPIYSKDLTQGFHTLRIRVVDAKYVVSDAFRVTSQ